MKLKPLHDYVIVKALAKETVTASGIVLPDTLDKEKPEQGEVVACGTGKILDNGQTATMSVKPGDKVMFRKYTPDEIKIDDVEYLVIKEADIMLIVE